MGKVVLDNKFWLMWFVPVVASVFSVAVQERGEFVGQMLLVGFYGFAFFYLCYWLLSFIPLLRIADTLKTALCVLSLVLTSIDLFCAYYLHMGFTPALVGTLLATNFREIHGFIHAMLLPHLGFVCLYVLCCCSFLWITGGGNLKPQI
ncbi:hypothetical protein [Helicobacter felistomachi]|uniref:hypothetical protein n=1 Tax=Helicobacter felistomachi TaxID=3040201 RepID=UPI002573FF33|nr:hypothetical protein [Helicobacter sp. NHP21005]